MDAHAPGRHADSKDAFHLAKQNPAVRFDADPGAWRQHRLAEYPQRTASNVKDMTPSNHERFHERINDGQAADGDVRLMVARQDYPGLINRGSLHAVGHLTLNRAATCDGDLHRASEWHGNGGKYLKAPITDGLKETVYLGLGGTRNLNLNERRCFDSSLVIQPSWEFQLLNELWAFWVGAVVVDGQRLYYLRG